MVVVPPNARCAACGYSLAYLEKPRCPECGRDFNPCDASSFDLARTARERANSVLLRIVRSQSAALQPIQIEPLLAWAGILALGFFLLPDWARSTCFWLAPPLVIAWCARLGIRRLKLGRCPDPYARSERLATVGYFGYCLFLATVLSYHDWSCDHGWARGIGPVGIANSKVGGPCRNHVGDLVAWHVTGNWYLWYGTRF